MALFLRECMAFAALLAFVAGGTAFLSGWV